MVNFYKGLIFFFLCKRVNVLYFICVEGTLYELLLRGKLYTNERKIWLSSYNIFKLGSFGNEAFSLCFKKLTYKNTTTVFPSSVVH